MSDNEGFDFGTGKFDDDGNLLVSVDTGYTRPPWSKVAEGLSQWSSTDADAWNSVKYALQDRFGFTNVTEFQSRVNQFASDFAKSNLTLPTEADILNSEVLNNWLRVLAAGYPSLLPPMFVNDGVLYENDPYNGPKAVTVTIPDDVDPADRKFYTDINNRFPTFTNEQLAEILGRKASSGTPGSRGPGRAARVFDRDQLIESATDRWKGLLLEDPDEAKIGSLVDSYAAKGNAFWMKQGGNLDFDTFVVNEVRKQSRYKTLYAKKDAYLTEEEWMGRYRGAVGQFGLGSQATLRETEAGLKTGAGLAGFTERVGRTREARLNNQGTFSQQFAQQFAASGLGKT